MPFGVYYLIYVYLSEKTPSPVSLGQNVHEENRRSVGGDLQWTAPGGHYDSVMGWDVIERI